MTTTDSTIDAFTASIMRGGTSRGVVLPLEALPPEGPRRDAFLVSLMGSNDPGQMDGFGGNTSTTSKVMMVGHDYSGDDVPYLFAQVDPRNPVVDYGGNCGNMTSAVALYAVLEGLVPTTPPSSDFNLVNLNTGTRIRAHVPTGADGPLSKGDYRIAGISAPGPEIITEYLDPAGREGQFPTGGSQDKLHVPSLGEVAVSIVDISSPLVFVRPGDVGLTGTELPSEIDGDVAMLDRLEAIRSAAAAKLGLVDDPDDATRLSPGIPKIAMVTAPAEYRTSLGEVVGRGDVDVVARIMSVQRAHHAYAMTGALCTAAATTLEGTIPHADAPQEPGPVRIGHPKGVTSVRVETRESASGEEIASVAVSRTARRLMRGIIEVPIRS